MKLAPFKANTFTLRQLLHASGVGYYIPLYQRPYRWTSKNAERLLEEIVDGIVAFQRTERSSTFLGTIITVTDRDSLVPEPTDCPTSVRHVIDGQQRIATLLVLCGELLRAIHSASAQVAAQRLEPIQQLLDRQQDMLTTALFFKLMDTDTVLLPRMIQSSKDTWGRIDHNYASPISKYLSSFDPTTPSEPTGSQLLDDVIDTIRKRLRRANLFRNRIGYPTSAQCDTLLPEVRLESYPDSCELSRLLILLTFSGFIMDGIQIILVDTEDENAAISVFEPLNTTSVGLTAFDTFVPSVVNASGGQLRYYDTWEEEQVSRFHRSLEGLTAKTLEMRTRQVLLAFGMSDTGRGIGKELEDQRLYLRTYRTLSRNKQRVFLEGLSNTAAYVRELWYAENPLLESCDLTQLALHMLRGSKHSITQGLLVRGYEELKVQQPLLFHRLIRAVASFWLLWRLSHSTTANVDGHYRKLMAGGALRATSIGPHCRRPRERYSAKRKSVHPDVVSADLRTILEEAGGIEGRDTWVDRVAELPHGRQGNKALLIYALLGAYSDTHPEGSSGLLKKGVPRSSTTLTMEWYQNTGLTVEHIAPQQALPEDLSFEPLIFREERFQRLGNLTLLPGRENKILGRRSWHDKQQYFKLFAEPNREARRIQIESLSAPLGSKTVEILLTDSYLPFGTDLATFESDQWTADQIAKRGECLAGLIWDRFAPSLGYPH